MSTVFTIFRSGLFCSLIFLIGCSPSAEKTTHKTHTVEIKQMQFQPAELLVQSGDTVIWINRDIVAHDVTEESGKAWTSSSLPTGSSWSLVVSKNFNYYCSIHLVMKGKLLVQ